MCLCCPRVIVDQAAVPCFPQGTIAAHAWCRAPDAVPGVVLTRHGYVQAFEARRFARREDLHVFLQEPEKSFIMAIRQLDHFDEVGLPRLLCLCVVYLRITGVACVYQSGKMSCASLASQVQAVVDEAVAEDRARSDGVASHGLSLSTVSCVIATNHAPCHRAQQLCELQGAFDHNGPPPRGTPLPDEVDMRWLSRWLLELRLQTL